MNIKTETTLKSENNEGGLKKTVQSQYWRANMIVVSSLLLVWFLVSFVFGILLSDELNAVRLYGFKLGFWWAHQGSIFIFVLLIFAYSLIMEKVDRHFTNMMEEGEQS